MNNKLIKSIFLHIRYPYTALIISIMWIGMAIIIVNQDNPRFELLIILTGVVTIIISLIGFKPSK